MEAQKNGLLIILTTGSADRGSRATIAFAMGVAGLISGVPVTMFLTVEGAFWSRRSAIASAHVAGFEPLQVYVDQFREAGGTLLVCSPCNDYYCSIGKESPLLEGAALAGLTAIVDVSLRSSVLSF
jgi:uncharacterized protein